MAGKFDFLIDLAQKAQQQAADRMQAAQVQLAAQEERLAQVDAFIADYQGRLVDAGRGGMGVERYLDFRAFLGKLTDARQTQEREVDRARQRFVLEREAWLAQRRKLKAYQTLAEREAARGQLAQRRREQKLVDEFATRNFLRPGAS
ncbi:flagellar export protein FliJ [Crenobacter intestini]|uniref:Flagellar FliJ protein n=1 Tax=Crenobacter intestini TaxID=2563443 RepID=A0A4T0USG5_9NEIS|nr:flagellar export protein FliJ [Crenobacter intestini]TIC81425.1 flagellar export protein FliJ [Crenobacter intestini]